MNKLRLRETDGPAATKLVEPGFGPRAAASFTAQALPKASAAKTSGKTALEQVGERRWLQLGGLLL